MNPLHYPSLELQIKLKKIGFTNCETVTDTCGNYIRHTPWFDTWEYNPCPNVMEMLDVIPDRIEHEWYSFSISLFNLLDKKIFIRYISSGWELDKELWKKVEYDKRVAKINGTLPNALAEMIIWLVENKHLTFK